MAPVVVRMFAAEAPIEALGGSCPGRMRAADNAAVPGVWVFPFGAN